MEERYIDFLVAPYCLTELFLAFDSCGIADFCVTLEDGDLHVRIPIEHLRYLDALKHNVRTGPFAAPDGNE